ncbi:hypothetical protein BROUX41_003767 [Berkeleyomyces rouxiae]|uniref:uncharacterized protein n=1 Tax=Berkeleyomyces rouxiae TaxID=2035830 RepID=UPI003B7AF230
MSSNLLHASPNLSQHLSDPSLTPLLTSACSQPTLESLTVLASAALTADAALTHLNMGAPMRILVEYDAEPPSPSLSSISSLSFSTPAPLAMPAAATQVLGSAAGTTTNNINNNASHARNPYLFPSSGSTSGPAAHATSSTPSCPASGPILLHSFIAPPERHDHDDPAPGPVEEPPLLVATVVGVSGDVTGEARRAASRIERIARDLHREWEAEERENTADAVSS